jgi:prepilin-type N-terminal cleavage/methylation domain-containing protein
MTTYRRKSEKHEKQKGFSLPELVIVVFIISIISVIALPQINAARRAFRFSGMQRQLGAVLTDARQQAMSQRKAITARYNDSQKEIIVYGGSYGTVNDSKNKIEQLYGSGIGKEEIVYGRPTGTSTDALGDGTNMAALAGGMMEITFQPDGTVLDASGNPENKTLFFYHKKNAKEMAFAISILGAGGRVKIWRYSRGVNKYVE